MHRKGNITIYKGTGKTSGKPFTALMLTVGKWNTLYFPKSSFEMEYIEKYLTEEVPEEKLDLEHETPISDGEGVLQ